MDKRLVILSVFLASALASVTSQAAVQTAQIQVMATVVSTCQVAATPIDFGSYDGTQIDTTGQVTVTCNAGVPFTMALDGGLNSNGANRMLTNGAGNKIPYRLSYSGADWGDRGVTDTYPGNPVVGAGLGGPQSFAVDARLFGAQDAPPGVYLDTVTLTLAF